MVWAGMGYHNGAVLLRIAFTSHRMNSRDYQQVLNGCLVPFFDRFGYDQHIFQQDNAPIHISRSTRRWLAARNIRVLPWPACSPDLNLIENLWGILVLKVYALNRQYQSVEELRNAIAQAWTEIDAEPIENLYRSMPTRIFQVINRNGGPTDY